MRPAEIIRAKRDGRELDRAGLEAFVRGFVAGEVAPYQMSAFLMAVYLRGMTPAETAELTRVMVESGETLRFPAGDGRLVDKHSTGGVGDLVSLPLAPLVAAAGVRVPMISGRGLAHTGGTLDKLESIPGFRTGLDGDAVRRLLDTVGFAMGGQTETLAPADRLMYALRDVTATVESVPLIVSSILSKKVAEGIDALVLDVKCGRGAFMTSEEDALRLAGELVRVGSHLGKEVVAFVTDMDQPLGTAVGNAVEVRAALDCLGSRGPADLMELVEVLGTAMLCLGRGGSWEENAGRLRAAVEDGSGRDRFRAMIEGQGGDPGVVDAPDRLPAAAARVTVTAPEAGWIVDLEPRALGEAVVELGGGRRRAGDPVDPSVGLELVRRRGERVEAGEPLAVVLAADRAAGERVAREAVAGAYRLGPEPPAPRALVRHLVTPAGTVPWTGMSSWEETMAKKEGKAQ